MIDKFWRKKRKKKVGGTTSERAAKMVIIGGALAVGYLTPGVLASGLQERREAPGGRVLLAVQESDTEVRGDRRERGGVVSE